MPHYPYLIVGGGIAADAAVRGIRQIDPDREIAILGSEPHPPYDRPPLSKELWKGGSLESIWRGTEALGVRLHLGRTATRLDPSGCEVHDDRGDRYTFDSLLLATGGTPRRIPGSPGEVIYFRTLEDYHRLRSAAERGGRFAVIGGGFIGSEIAAALRTNGLEVLMIFEEPAIAWRTLPPDLAHSLNRLYAARGIELWTGESVAAIEKQGDGLTIRTRSGRSAQVSGIVAGLGIEPNVGLARAAGLPVADGIQVDEALRAGHPHIYAAGDVAGIPSPALGRRLRVEHEDNANASGVHAGRAMAGEPAPYRHLAYFYSDLFDLSYEAVGELEPGSTQLLADWREPLREGVVYYLRGGRVRGVLLWNVRAKVRAARRIIEQEAPVRPDELIGRLVG